MSRGVREEDARDFCIIGCVEPHVSGKMDGWHGAAFFNLVKVLEITLNNGRNNGEQVGPQTGEITSFTSYEALEEAYRQQTEYFVDLMVKADNAVDVAHGERTPLPYMSSLIHDCIANGKSVQEGGARYGMSAPQGVGVANVADALMAVKTLVFDEKKLTLAKLKEILESNYGKGIDEGTLSSFTGRKDSAKAVRIESTLSPEEGEYYRQMIINGAAKYGNDIDEVDQIAHDSSLIYCHAVERYKCARGGTFHPGLYPVSANVPMGKVCGATPDGRRAGEPLAEGVSPVSGRDKYGPTAVLNSVARLDHVMTSNGTLLNQKFHPSALSGEQGLKNLVSLVRSYFDSKGLHVQFNVVDRNTLLDAQKNPERHKNLLVRVAGYSAHFVHLNRDIQNDIISRTEQCF
jgi:formate C-acetyltransferase